MPEVRLKTWDEWYKYAEDNRGALAVITASYHPHYRTPGGTNLPITAHGAEAACIEIRKQIRDTSAPSQRMPTLRLLNAIKEKNSNEILQILNEVWFGVPESTLCWNLEGWQEMLNLIEDVPE